MIMSIRTTDPDAYERRLEMLAGLIFFDGPADLAVLQPAARAFIESVDDRTYTEIFLRAEEPDSDTTFWLNKRLFRALVVQGGWYLNLRPYLPRPPSPDTDPGGSAPPQRERPTEERERAARKKKRDFGR